jgi:hypothetical protein
LFLSVAKTNAMNIDLDRKTLHAILTSSKDTEIALQILHGNFPTFRSEKQQKLIKNKAE